MRTVCKLPAYCKHGGFLETLEDEAERFLARQDAPPASAPRAESQLMLSRDPARITTIKL
jgi:hypothetical protein